MEPFETYRPKLFAVAYKMTKRVADAEDIVQDMFIRFSQQPQGIQNPEAYWVKAVMNRCLDLLEKKSHIAYVGNDLPEPLYSARFEEVRQHDVSYALLMLLQKLNPVERAVFILRETLEYGYPEIAGTLELDEAHCRQLLHRAKEKIAHGKIRHMPSAQERKLLVDAFVSGAGGEVNQLLAYLKDDIVIYADGGGKVSAATKPIVGPAHCAAYLNGLHQKYGHILRLEASEVNGEAAVLFRRKDDGIVDTVMLMDYADGGIAAIYLIRNPDKLQDWQHGASPRKTLG